MGLTIERHLCLTFNDQREIVDEYRRIGVDYPKFFKMDSDRIHSRKWLS